MKPLVLGLGCAIVIVVSCCMLKQILGVSEAKKGTGRGMNGVIHIPTRSHMVS